MKLSQKSQEMVIKLREEVPQLASDENSRSTILTW